VLTKRGWLKTARVLEVRLRAHAAAPHGLRHNTLVTFHHYASETQARLILLEGAEMQPGSEAWAQLRLQRPVPVLNGDHFVIRDAASTLGGGLVVTTSERRQSIRRADRTIALDQQRAGGAFETLFDAIRRDGPVAITEGSSFAGMDPTNVKAGIAVLVAAGRVAILGTGEGRLAYTRDGLASLTARALESIRAYQSLRPMRLGMPKEELRSRLGLTSNAFADALATLVATAEIEDRGSLVSLRGWQARLTPPAVSEAAEYLAALRKTPFAPVATPPADEVLRYLIDAGDVVRLEDGTVFDAAAYVRMVELTVGLIQCQRDASLAEVRDLLGTSRRYVQPFLEHLDQQKLTLRRGDRRVLRGSPP